MRVFLMIVGLGVFLSSDALANEARPFGPIHQLLKEKENEPYRFLHYHPVLRNTECVGDLTTLECVLETFLTCSFYYLWSICEGLNVSDVLGSHPPDEDDFEHASRRSHLRAFYKVLERRRITVEDLPIFQSYEGRDLLKIGDFLFRIAKGVCVLNPDFFDRSMYEFEGREYETACQGPEKCGVGDYATSIVLRRDWENKWWIVGVYFESWFPHHNNPRIREDDCIPVSPRG